MGQFKCNACGRSYYDSHNFTSCPYCGGFCKTDQKCTCVHYCGFGGQRLNIIYKKDPNCPVHGEKEKMNKGEGK